jgi:RNA polymerase sigma-70 factor (ECF subfamily)
VDELSDSDDRVGDVLTLLTDNLLLKRIGQGDEASFEAVFHQHYDRVYGLLFRLVGSRAEAEDLTQEVFLKLYQHAFRKRLFGRGRDHNLSAWLYRVATNTGYNAIRDRQRLWQHNTTLVPDLQKSPTAESLVVQQEQETAVRKALTKLKPRQAQLLLMRQMDFSYAECAAACEVAPGSVGTLLARAASAFREAYETEAGE